jgi:hypothetical protein
VNTRLEYLYRDASNYKRWGEVVFAGEPTAALRERFTSALHEGEWFIAEQVRLPNVFLDDFPINDDDHCWHEFFAFASAGGEVTDAHERTMEQLVTEFEGVCAAGWKEFARIA